jgi:hypothetical protein
MSIYTPLLEVDITALEREFGRLLGHLNDVQEIMDDSYKFDLELRMSQCCFAIKVALGRYNVKTLNTL